MTPEQAKADRKAGHDRWRQSRATIPEKIAALRAKGFMVWDHEQLRELLERCRPTGTE
jgi:hypothetical protein